MFGFLRYLADRLDRLSLRGLVALACDEWDRMGVAERAQLGPPSDTGLMLLEMAARLHGVEPSAVQACPPTHPIGLFHWRNLFTLLKKLSPAERTLAQQITQLSSLDLSQKVVDPAGSTIWVVDSHFHLDKLLDHRGRKITTMKACYMDLFDHSQEAPTYGVSMAVASYAFPEAWPSAALMRALSRSQDLRICIGVHPSRARAPYSADLLNELLRCAGVVGVGECGLDYTYGGGESMRGAQHRVFREMLRVALMGCWPVVIHCRGESQSGVSGDCLTIMSEVLKNSHRVYRHCFDGDAQEMAEWRGAFPNVIFGVSPVLLRNSCHPGLAEAIRCTPLDELVLESDAPYLTAKHPWGLASVISRVAQLKRLPEFVVAEGTRQTAGRFYRW